MPNREKVIKGLEAHATGSGCMKNCPYWGIETLNCSRELATDALAMLNALYAFKSYFDDLYGAGLGVANWHMNGEMEPFDNFYESAMEEYENA